jgi:hypothetical protein
MKSRSRPGGGKEQISTIMGPYLKLIQSASSYLYLSVSALLLLEELFLNYL